MCNLQRYFAPKIRNRSNRFAKVATKENNPTSSWASTLWVFGKDYGLAVVSLFLFKRTISFRKIYDELTALKHNLLIEADRLLRIG